MGKRLMLERQPTDRSVRKRKRAEIKDKDSEEVVVTEKCQRISHGYESHENDDEDSLSSGSGGDVGAALVQTPQAQARSLISLASNEKHNSIVTESPRPVYSLRPSVVNGTILRDVLSKAWRLGRPIGKGNFGEIFLASDETVCPVSSESAKYVVKIEPHSNGPLFVEIHCLINTSQTKVTNGHENDEAKPAKIPPILAQGPPSGIPSYIASGTHYFGDGRYRFLVLPRFDRDLHSLIKNSRVQQKSVLVLAIHIVNVLEYLHDKGYCHNDIKAQNLMISKCKYLQRQAVARDKHYEEKQQTTDSGNSSEQETTNDDDYFLKRDEKFALKRMPHIDKGEDMDEDEDFDDGATTNSNNSNSLDCYQTPVNKNRGRQRTTGVEYSGSNPVRSCRREKRNSMYEEMVKSHYLRPTKRVSYREEFNEDGYPIKEEEDEAEGGDSDQSPVSSDNESEEFLPPSVRRSNKKSSASFSTGKRLNTRRQQKLKKERELVTMTEEPSRSRDSKQRPKNTPQNYQLIPVEEEHVFLIDYGLASKYQDGGVHRPFIMDQRRAHDGTLEFTSRDAHMGAHSRRSDLECLGYNLLYWSEGYLPWKDVANQQQQEKVHRAKELFMTNVSEMSRQFYGKQVPKYLGEFLKLIGQLAYQERPNYQRYRNMFKREYRRLGHDPKQMRLSSDEILATCISVKDEVDGVTLTNNKCDIFDVNNKIFSNAMRHSVLHTPFQEHSLTNRVSPKNLRSKSDKKNVKKKSFSWAEVLLQDPDQIARERAVKEFEREEEICPLKSRLPRRYEGKPTYAILAVEQSRRDKGLIVQEHNNEHYDDDNNQLVHEDKDNKDDEDQKEENQDVVDDATSGTEDSDSEEGRVGRRGGKIAIAEPATGRVRKRTTSNNKQPTKLSRVSAVKGKLPPVATGHLAMDKSTPLSAVVASNKRGCATRKEQQASAASATGETERKFKANQSRRMEDHHHHHQQQQQQQDEQQQPKQRRTRRCLHKTEAIMGVQQDVENNSKNNSELLPIQQSVYGDYDDENNYGAKGRNVQASSRHCRK